MRILVGALFLALLAGCAVEKAERVVSPMEQLWQEAYCRGDPVLPGDELRIQEWVRMEHVDCPFEPAKKALVSVEPLR